MNKGIDDFLQMGCKEKHTPINEYRKRGGLKGYAFQLLQDELSKAELDTNHCLHTTVQAIKNNDLEIEAALEQSNRERTIAASTARVIYTKNDKLKWQQMADSIISSR